jgi:hypothetical protein
MIPVVQHLHRALGIDRDGHRIIERNIERPQSVAVETAARADEVVMMPPLILRTRP